MRLIDADALDAEMYRKSFEVDDGRNVWNSGLWIRYKIYEEAIRDAPTVDAAPVIRCKDCFFRSEKGYCNLIVGIEMEKDDDDYCSRAERKEE